MKSHRDLIRVLDNRAHSDGYHTEGTALEGAPKSPPKQHGRTSLLRRLILRTAPGSMEPRDPS